MNATAESMLIHRCYCAWGSNKYVLYPLAFAAFVLNGFDLGCVISITIGHSDPSKDSNRILLLKTQPMDIGVSIAIAVLHVILTFMTGGRIWWIGYQYKRIVGEEPHGGRYNQVVAIITESGLLYASTLLVMVAVNSTFTTNPAVRGLLPFDVGVISGLMSGLAPNLIIVRVAYGKPKDSVQQMMSSLRFRAAEERSQDSDLQSSATATATRRAGTDLQLQRQNRLGISGSTRRAASLLNLPAARHRNSRVDVPDVYRLAQLPQCEDVRPRNESV
ncbi:hypothetical protein E1B28_007889 [Marasmius oreades]|uniref:Uncharacterized protein n=1 Tax=Marasmius oreades TaxID=181124 RepID=A0A9P7S374_9AGAR|nr:uncharacterized protein E1B28_007889 [Marasmius oreades]KAG7094285.1 hypothetical protein E1B28_007889 [Marasmius oreades]